MKTQIKQIDALQGTEELPDKSVDCVITSPPYWQLKDYGYPEQWGLEPTYHEYLEHLIAGCPERGIILDPFPGMGTTLVRAVQLNRKYIGFDLSEEYCKIALDRLREAESVIPLFGENQ